MCSIEAQFTQEEERGCRCAQWGLHFIAIKVVSLNTSRAVARVAVRDVLYRGQHGMYCRSQWHEGEW